MPRRFSKGRLGPGVMIMEETFYAPLVPDMEMERDMEKHQNKLCLGNPRMLVDIFERYGRPQYPTDKDHRLKWFNFLSELDADHFKDPNSVPEFFKVIERKYGTSLLAAKGKMFVALQRTPAFSETSLAKVASQVRKYEYPYAPEEILPGTHCMLVAEDYWLFSTFPKNRRDPDMEVINYIRHEKRLEPMPEVYVTKRYKFLCTNMRTAEKIGDREIVNKGPGVAHVRVVLVDPDEAPGRIEQYLNPLQNPKNKKKT